MNYDVAFPFENAGWPALLVDPAAMISYANRMALKVFAPELENLPVPLAKIWASDNKIPAEHLQSHWERSPNPTMALKFRLRTGTVTYTVSVCSCLQTSQKCLLLQLLPLNTEAAVAQKQKLDCALQMARTVSLDFNNALTTVLSHTSYLLGKAQTNHPWRDSLLEVEKAAARAAETSADLGTFSRQEKETRAPSGSNLNALLQRTVDTLQQAPGGHLVKWTLQLERELYATRFDEAKLQQAFVKILENALEAQRASGGIVLQSRNFETAETFNDEAVSLPPGAYVCVEITDDGEGMAPEVLPRVFEPFFTTKKTGNHRGLGLALVYGIVTNHGGSVAVSSQLGLGTSVRVYLPADKQVVVDKTFVSGELGGHETILVVDDDDLLLNTCRIILSNYGYTVVPASSAQQAIDILNRNETKIDLVFTDLVMPGMSGRELVDHLKKSAPGMRVICSTGSVWPGNGDKELRLQKPFTSQDLLRKVRQALSGQPL
jgi:two-component system, cell cycle sensor histidine kinase and response regulator CckA